MTVMPSILRVKQIPRHLARFVGTIELLRHARCLGCARHDVTKKAGLPCGKPAFLLQIQKHYWRAAGVAVLAVMGEETRLASLVLL
ncbi:hypothetical protein HBN54_004353 [Hymenobacter sp. 1B]|uniref:Uncharacterized protein n=1 Tax=Hymenobacter artigasi TaxID=2719616 RepID=A0ABX1HRB8_9BACT|nr:hypothetical protein [Hymenobacter artigasi]